VFIRHLEWLAKRGWRSLTAEEFAFYAMRRGNRPAKSFLLTFDDGYESIASSALRVLKDLNFKAVCFLSTKSIRHPPALEASASHNESESAFLSWQQVRELQSAGWVEFHSHTHAHKPLSGLTRSELAADLAASLDHLANELGLPRAHFRHLAWPWGESHNESRQIAEKLGFHYQYTVARSAFLRNSSVYNIPRTCYDGATLTNFAIQFQMQTGMCSRLWHAAYPLARKIRRPSFTISFQEENSNVQVTARPS
jgi:peptidoglycan/xylan/chitin deacetylase (PgdA/CDA1 family)